LGGVVAVAAGVDESDLGVDAFDEGIRDTQFDRCDDFFEVDLEPFGQGDEGVDAAAFGGGDPAPKILAGAAGWMVNAVDVAQLFLERPGAADAAVGAGDLADQGPFVVGEFVFPSAQRPAGGLPVWGCSSRRGLARWRPRHRRGPGRGLTPLHEVERVITDRGLRGVGAGGARCRPWIRPC